MRDRPFRQVVRLILCVALISPVASAQSRVGHYIRTHKRLLAADALLMAGWAADAASSVHDQRSGCCIEHNPILGPHPSPAATWAYAMGISSLLITGEHLIWWAGNKYGDTAARDVLIWPVPIAHGISEFYTVRDNARYASDSNLRIARERLSH